jgi:hypothetical protein
MLSQYFNRDEEIEGYLKRYNDEFPDGEHVKARFLRVAKFIQDCRFGVSSRIWKKADFFTAFVEIDYLVNIKGMNLGPSIVERALDGFYAQVEKIAAGTGQDNSDDPARYGRAALQATNDRSNRVIRGTIIRNLLSATAINSIAAK